ncbi:MAG: hypothetical protein Q3997_01265 [Propionibacteriaceae bacterium]|nr:hypothetical protein [Propionibacteriaceae bacterium]
MRRLSWVVVLPVLGCAALSPGAVAGTGATAAAIDASPSIGAASLSESPVPAQGRDAKPASDGISPARYTLAQHPDLTSGRSAIAFAPLSHPDKIVVLGSVPSSKAWSTSKVLVVCAYLKEVAGGDPGRLTQRQEKLINKALSASDLDALLTLRSEIKGGSGAPMTQILRSIGDTETVAPDRREGSMTWTAAQQVRFMAALHHGKVVSPVVSKYVLERMRPVPSQAWGLGTVGASAYKGGWLTRESETRQMGIVDGYAVAIITNGVGPAELQSDGDWAHVSQLDKLAGLLREAIKQG